MTNYECIDLVVTFTAGVVTLAIFFLQKRNKKKEAAGILLMEIRRVEKILDLLRCDPIILDTVLVVLPSNKWLNYAHLFLEDFDQD